jgi:hypothetical protein
MLSACLIGVGITLVDVGPTQQIVESADPDQRKGRSQMETLRKAFFRKIPIEGAV